MIEGIPRISVLVICYKQEELIKRAINSLLAQKDYIYEICVSDDCSPDKTWDVLQDYNRQYPGLFKLNRNEPNIGIFENIEKTWEMPTGDIVYQLSGDDECGEGWFKAVVNFIQDNHIDYNNELFCVYGNVETVFPSGDVIVNHGNRAVLKYDNSFSLAIRSFITGRSACYSINILKKFFKCSNERSYCAENAIDRELQIFTKRTYYINAVGNRYYSGIGVSSNEMKQKTSTAKKDYKKLNTYLVDKYVSNGIAFELVDINYFQYSELFHILKQHFTLRLFLKCQYYKMKQKLPGVHNRKSILYYIKRLYFALVRRLPHKYPVYIHLG